LVVLAILIYWQKVGFEKPYWAVYLNTGNVGPIRKPLASNGVNIGTAAPSQKLDVGSGNVSANDYWIAAAGKWASQAGQAGHNNCYLLDFPPGTGERHARWCMAGYYMAGYFRFGEGDLERFYCCRP